MYRLILVDDESEIREGLKEVIPFERFGFSVVGEASNGVEALQLCEQTEPDLLITDIRMPLMDGLTLCRRARQLLPTIHCIILSGYDDFEYAKQAIELRTICYMLKPISSDEFIQMLESTRRTLDEEFGRRRDEARLQELFRESLPIMRESLLGSLLSSSEPTDEVVARAARYGIELHAPAYTLALLRPGKQGDGIRDRELLLLAIRDTVRDALQGGADDARVEAFAHDGMLALLFLMRDDDEASSARLVERLDEARKTARHYLDCEIFIGISAVCPQLRRLPNAARQALAALHQCMLSREEQVLCITDVERNPENDLVADDTLLASLSNGIRARDDALARDTLHELMNAARVGRPSPRAWQAYLMEILMCYLRILSEQALDWDGLDKQMDALVERILHGCLSVDEAEGELERFLTPLLREMETHRLTFGRQLAVEAERYLQENFTNEDASLEQLCLHLHISPSYFSMLFKRETHKTFHQYITDLRMDKALSLLSTSSLKISQIAESVGLPDPSYFSYCFKKHFGYPPSRTRGGGTA